ncbi:hypothetical protein BGZ80_005239 [Entomortierella chlamydospora]|uniref:BZIP domain-containing protein n=1 Tax=Entomortierella chlamydospora TaxID=101097 RepID=A0A9P6N3W1_9FUNG|nr:hypothetical protein BGZ79_002611 [Entomortierella chlamydospora]KAG0024201.1 hypothetical protein BGZ80_005239 [Entomortierella chlamydospora]
MEYDGMSPGVGLNLENFSPFDTSYKFLNSGIPRLDSASFDSVYNTPTSTVPMLTQQHPWSDMMFDESSYVPFHQMSPNSSPSSTDSDASDSFRSRMSSTSSDNLISNPEASQTHTHEYNAVFDSLVPSKKSYHSDQDLPSLAPDSPTPDSLTPDSLVPSDTLKHTATTTSSLNCHDYQQFGPQDDTDYDNQEMSDQHESSMDVDSDDSNDEDEGEGEINSSKSSSRESSSASEDATIKARPTRASTRQAAKAAKSKPKSSSKSTSRARKSSGCKKSSTSRKAKSQSNNSKPSNSSQSRKHSSPEEESPEAKRQKFLERNRMAASKCREKKRLQTLKTIADADAITARNQALHESLGELQEEVRSLKNQILCHRDCGCNVIQKFVQSSFGASSYMTGSNSVYSSTHSQVHLC